MPNWVLFLLTLFVVLGLRTRTKWNPNVVAVAVTIVVLAGVAAREHLIPV